MKSELNDVLQSGYYGSPLGCNNVAWFVDEVIRLEIIMAFCFKNTKEDISITKKDDEHYSNINICMF